MQTKIYRPGAVGALLDIYEQVISDLIKVIGDIPDNTLTIITDPQTTDENCKSLQAILSHVVHSAYGYATGIRNLAQDNIERPAKTFHITVKEYYSDLNNAFAYTHEVFNKIKDSELEQLEDALKIITGWGQYYDIEQMMEHAIVHILRHTRQITRIKEQMGFK